jgi:uncharacterized membrane protein YeaQ/YmgE (transglycosylase-associated protein family)
MSLLGYLVIGFLAGVVAAFVTRTERSGCITTIATGVLGSFIGGWVVDALGVDGPGPFVTALLGAVALLIVLRVLGLAKKR